MAISERNLEVVRMRERGMKFHEIGTCLGMTGSHANRIFREHRRLAEQTDLRRSRMENGVEASAVSDWGFSFRTLNILSNCVGSIETITVAQVAEFAESRDFRTWPNFGANGRKEVLEFLDYVGVKVQAD